MRPTSFLLAASFSLFCVSVATTGEPARPMTEMRGDCSNYLTDIQSDLVLWERPADSAPASADFAKVATASLDRRLRVSLKPHPEVRFAAPPEQMRGAADKFSGLIAVTTAAAGAYRLSASNGLWLDVVGPEGVIASRTFEMQTKCDRIFKTVTYDLPANTSLIVQLNGSSVPEVDLLVHRIAQ